MEISELFESGKTAQKSQDNNVLVISKGPDFRVDKNGEPYWRDRLPEGCVPKMNIMNTVISLVRQNWGKDLWRMTFPV